MVKLMINGQEVSVKNGTTIMDAAEKVGIHIPHLCYLKGINEIGACRVCVVEIKGMEKLVTACNTVCEDGMEIFTNSPRVRRYRRINVELILSDHNANCASCIKSGNCTLQQISNDLGIILTDYENIAEKPRWDINLPLIQVCKMYALRSGLRKDSGPWSMESHRLRLQNIHRSPRKQRHQRYRLLTLRTVHNTLSCRSTQRKR